VAGYNVDENLTPVLLTAIHTCFMSHLLGLVLVLCFGLERAGLGLGLGLVTAGRDYNTPGESVQHPRVLGSR